MVSQLGSTGMSMVLSKWIKKPYICRLISSPPENVLPSRHKVEFFIFDGMGHQGSTRQEFQYVRSQSGDFRCAGKLLMSSRESPSGTLALHRPDVFPRNVRPRPSRFCEGRPCNVKRSAKNPKPLCLVEHMIKRSSGHEPWAMGLHLVTLDENI